MTELKFLIAKFAPDLHRMEPRNFGLLVWTPERMTARFLGEQTGKVRAPSFVQPDDRHAYRQWVEYWRAIMAKESIRTDSGRVVPRESAEFLDVLRSKAKPQFLLVEGGKMIDLVQGGQIEELADEFFESLIQEIQPTADRQHKAQLLSATEEVFERSGVKETGSFKKGVPVPCRIGHKEKPFKFDYGILRKNHLPKVIFQRVILPQDKSVQSTLFMFERLRSSRAKRLRGIARCAMVYANNGDISHSPVASMNLELLEEYANHVINVARADEASKTVAGLFS